MIQKLKVSLLSLVALLALTLPIAVGMSASASAATDSPSIQGNLCSGADNLTLDTTSGTCVINGSSNCDLDCVLTKVINVFSVVVGIVAVIMIILGGFRYISSGGGDGVKKAKDTILYAIIGLVIVAMAQVIVRFVLNKATS